MTNKNYLLIAHFVVYSKLLVSRFLDWADSTESAVEEELSVWEDNWDDDNLDVMDDFNEQLKQQMNKK